MWYTVESSYNDAESEAEMGYRGLEKSPEYRVAYVVPLEHRALFTDMPGVYLYEPLTLQLQRAV